MRKVNYTFIISKEKKKKKSKGTKERNQFGILSIKLYY